MCHMLSVLRNAPAGTFIPPSCRAQRSDDEQRESALLPGPGQRPADPKKTVTTDCTIKFLNVADKCITLAI